MKTSSADANSGCAGGKAAQEAAKQAKRATKKKKPRMRMADAFRNRRIDEHFVAGIHALAGRNLKKAESKLCDTRLRLMLEYLKEWTRVLEPPRSRSAQTGAAGDGGPVQMTLVHNVARPVRPAPMNAPAVNAMPVASPISAGDGAA